jgi:hypothetical protein
MKTYAIKTTKGYLATQGNRHWFESAPVGWALFCEREHAAAIAEAHHSAIGTRPDEGYTIEETTHAPKQ